ncbi:hypothetical protein DRJ17_00620 [Candidatus Woesearchaeota archaeon]|nr:MAG: hypothetical protein DRJ17_00620 [Candidatus Woesearchaeota archaeon]
MRVTISLKKSVGDNASSYYEKAKKAKKKIEGVKKAIAIAEKKIEEIKAKKIEVERRERKVKRKPNWYEKFRWFVSSEGFLCIGGRDATTNEIIIKKHTDKNDLIFHTDMAGSPFFVVKKDSVKDREIGSATLKEVAQATASYSRAWKLGMSSIEVFYVRPEQVSKKAKAGEYLPKGAFMIQGKTTYLKPIIELAVGICKDGSVMGGPVDAVKKNCEKFVVIQQDTRAKTSDTAKSIQKIIGGEIDDIIRALPTGGAKIKK